MGQAINKALDMIEERKASYREHGIAYYRPWAFLITDGEPNDHWKPTIPRVKDGERQKSFSFFAVGVEGADMERARRRFASASRCGSQGLQVPRAVQLAVEFAAGRFPFLPWRRSSAAGSDVGTQGMGASLGGSV